MLKFKTVTKISKNYQSSVFLERRKKHFLMPSGNVLKLFSLYQARVFGPGKPLKPSLKPEAYTFSRAYK
jgi:hypothetical protein